MSNRVPVSLIIPCFSRPKQTLSLLHSLRDSDHTCELIMIDDNSPCDYQGLLKQFYDLEIRYERNNKNYGPAYSRNRGIKMATQEYVAFTDNDCTVARDWLGHIHKSILEAPEQIAGVGGRVVAKGKDIFSRYYDYHKVLDPWYYNGQYYYITTANAIYKKYAVQAVGGFDEQVASAGGEDPGLCFKLLNIGYAFGYNPEAIVIHEYESSLISFMRTYYRYGYGCCGQSRKYFTPKSFVEDNAYGGYSR